MYKKVISWMIIITLFISLGGCSGGNNPPKVDGKGKTTDQESPDTHNPTNPPQQDIEDQEKELDPIEEQIKKMTMNEKIGQMVMVGLDGYTLDESSKRMIEDYHVGGFILFGRNVESSNQLLTLMNALKSTNAKNNIPLFLSVDEEGGRVSRMPGEFKDIPSNRTIGQKNDKTFSYEIGRVIAEQIKSFGFNMNFAPVLDVDSNPDNPVIGDRSFGSDEKIVSKLGTEAMKGIQSRGIIPVVKHFPGHGDTSVDSHIGLPAVDKDLNNLNQFELIPFTEAIKNNTDAVMIAHILLNKIDTKNPASLSKTVITNILRNQLDFDGVVITDDMTMGAIIKNYDIGEAAVKSVNAGSDIVLVCHGYENEMKVLNTLKEAVENGSISKERIDESVYRILELKNKYNLADGQIDSIDIDKINADISTVLDTYL